MIKLFLILLVSFLSVFPQSNLKVRPRVAHRISWAASNEPDVYRYGIFWTQGADTTLFPFRNGTNPDSLWNNEAITNWSFAEVSKLYYYHEPNPSNVVNYIRYGVAPINSAGQFGKIRTHYKVIRIITPAPLPKVNVE